MIKPCVAFEVDFKDAAKIKSTISDLVWLSDAEDYYYLHYGSSTHLLVGLVDANEIVVRDELDKLEKRGIIVSSPPFKPEKTLDASKILACAARKIVDIIEEDVGNITVDRLVDYLIAHKGCDDINETAYTPLHFICLQADLQEPDECDVRLKLIGNKSIKWKIFENKKTKKQFMVCH